MAVPGIGVLAVGLGDVVLDVAIGAVIFVVVCVVAAVLMALLQSVLPRVDTGAEAVHRAELEAEAGSAPAGLRLDDLDDHRGEEDQA